MHIFALAPVPHRIFSAVAISSTAFLVLKIKELMLQLSYHKNSIQTSVGSGKALVGVSEVPSQSGEVTEMS